MIEIAFDSRILHVCPQLKIGLVRAHVVNESTCDELWGEIEREAKTLKSSFELLEINERPAIAATRKLYKAFGKDPGRYRVASEALSRRIIKGVGLYRLTTLVDAVNLVSIRSGYAISGLDAQRIVGDKLVMGVGQAGEEFHGIGRGLLNIEGLPVYRDAQGAIATPTSDEERTKFTRETQMAQININGFGPEMPMDEAVDWMKDLLVKYAKASQVETRIIDPF